MNRKMLLFYTLVLFVMVACESLGPAPPPITRGLATPIITAPRLTSTHIPTPTPFDPVADLATVLATTIPTPLPTEDWGGICALSEETGELEPALEIGQEIDLTGYLELLYITLMGERNGVGWAQVGFRPVAFHVYHSDEYEEACELLLRLDYITELGPNRMQRFSQDPSQVIILDNNLRMLTGFGDQIHRIRVRGVVCDEYAASELGANVVCVEELELLAVWPR